MRDDFSFQTKELLAKRVGHRCSNPGCRQSTSGPRSEPDKSINVGVASHISAAAPAGPRYDDSLTPDQRRAPENGIWLCQNCAKMVDNDSTRYTVDVLRQWNDKAEAIARREIERPAEKGQESGIHKAVCDKIQKWMPNLLAEMRNDLKEYPLRREFVVLEKSWIYNARGKELAYYYEDHE